MMMASERRFAEVRRILENAGYRLVRVSGSHHLFEKAGQQLVSIPVHGGKVKPHYVRQVEKIIGEENNGTPDTSSQN